MVFEKPQSRVPKVQILWDFRIRTAREVWSLGFKVSGVWVVLGAVL